jgi:peptide chain release factor 3
VRLLDTADGEPSPGAARKSSLDRSAGKRARCELREEAGARPEACKPFDLAAFREGHLTPVYFGSALRDFGVRDLIDGARPPSRPPPRAQEADTRKVEATSRR